MYPIANITETWSSSLKTDKSTLNANKYFFIRVWNASGDEASDAEQARPIAWLAPVWTGR